jgi:2Fe-2S ferredoxin
MTTINVTDRTGAQHAVDAKDGLTLMEPLRDLSDGVEALCGGMCSCSTCHIFVARDWAARLTPPKDDELELLEGSEFYRAGESRLACQIRVSPAIEGITLTVAPSE